MSTGKKFLYCLLTISFLAFAVACNNSKIPASPQAANSVNALNLDDEQYTPTPTITFFPTITGTATPVGTSTVRYYHGATGSEILTTQAISPNQCIASGVNDDSGAIIISPNDFWGSGCGGA